MTTNLIPNIRSFGKGYEEFYKTSQEKYGIEFIRGKPAQIFENDDLTLTIRAEDTLLGKVTEYTYDLVVLSVGLEHSAGSDELRQTLGLSRSADGFYMEAHPKLRPVDTLTDGVYIAGVAQGPKDIPDSVAQGSAQLQHPEQQSQWLKEKWKSNLLLHPTTKQSVVLVKYVSNYVHSMLFQSLPV